MIVADASWIIALRDPNDKYHSSAVFTNRGIGEAVTLLHPITLAECLVAPAKLGDVNNAAEALRRAFEIPKIDSEAPLRWALLRAETSLRLPDAIVLDTAIHNRTRAVATFDDQLAVCAVEHGFEILGSQAT